MFMRNGMLCTLQNYNDSSDRGATRALLPYLWERFCIPHRDAMKMGRHQRYRHWLGSRSYVNMLARSEGCIRVKKWASQAKNRTNTPLIIYNQHRLGLQTWKEKQGAKTTGLKTGRKSTRDQRKMEQRVPPRQRENCFRKNRWSRQSPYDLFFTVTLKRVPTTWKMSG